MKQIKTYQQGCMLEIDPSIIEKLLRFRTLSKKK